MLPFCDFGLFLTTSMSVIKVTRSLLAHVTYDYVFMRPLLIFLQRYKSTKNKEELIQQMKKEIEEERKRKKVEVEEDSDDDGGGVNVTENVPPGKLIEPGHDKTNKMTCAPSEDSDQPWHPYRLI